MKKLLMISLCCFILCGCTNKNEKLESLIGKWSKDELQYSQVNVTTFNFYDDGTFGYKIKLMRYNDTKGSWDYGFHKWEGKYKVENNIIFLDVTSSDTSFDMKDCQICMSKEPEKKYIIDFDKMIICSRDDGIDCEYPFKKE